MMTKTHSSHHIVAATALAAALLSIGPVLAGSVSISQSHSRHFNVDAESTVYKSLDQSIVYKSPIAD